MSDSKKNMRELKEQQAAVLEMLRNIEVSPEDVEAGVRKLQQQLADNHSDCWKEIKRLKGLIGYPPVGPDGAGPEEWYPRALTWHAERQNWIEEVERLRLHITELEGGTMSQPVKQLIEVAQNILFAHDSDRVLIGAAQANKLREALNGCLLILVGGKPND